MSRLSRRAIPIALSTGLLVLLAFLTARTATDPKWAVGVPGEAVVGRAVATAPSRPANRGDAGENPESAATSETALSASDGCPAGSMSESEAEERALGYAAVEQFSSAVVLEAELLTRDQLAALHSVEPAYVVTCYWYVEMSGEKVFDRWPPGLLETPTPGPATVFTTMVTVMDGETGFLASKGLSTDPLFTPSPPTPGPSPTLIPPPTVPPAIPPPPRPTE